MATPKIEYIKSKGFNVNIWLNDPAALESFEKPVPGFFPGYSKPVEEVEVEEEIEETTDENTDDSNDNQTEDEGTPK